MHVRSVSICTALQVQWEYLFFVMVVRGVGSGGRPRSKLKTGWTSSAAAWTAPARPPRPQAIPAAPAGGPKLRALSPGVLVGPEQPVQGLWSCRVADVRRLPSLDGRPSPINLDLGGQICKMQMSDMRFCFRRELFTRARYETPTHAHTLHIRIHKAHDAMFCTTAA